MDIRTAEAGAGVQWFVCGWRLFVKSPWLWIAMLLVFMVILAALSAFPVVGQLASALLYPPLFAGMMYGARQVESGAELDIAQLFQGFTDKPRLNPLLTLGALALVANIVLVVVFVLFLGSGLMMALISGGGDIEPGNAELATLGLLGMLGALVFLVLSMIVFMALLYSPALVMLDDIEPMEALKSSFQACLRNWLALLVFGIVYFGLAVLAVIPFGLGLIVFAPVSVCAVYCSYREIYGQPSVVRIASSPE